MTHDPNLDPRPPASSFRELANQLPPLTIDEPPTLDERLHRRKHRIGAPSRPLLATLGGLPIRRSIPQDVHSLMDYANGLVAAACAMKTDDRGAQVASVVLATSVLGVSAVTDYRLSLARVIPIETHEIIDHAWGLTAIAAPFVLGYWKTAPKIALAHVVAGIGTCVASLFTDYRAYSRRSQTAAR